eukprot:20647-Pleurochrysis_carterae.AAC.2
MCGAETDLVFLDTLIRLEEPPLHAVELKRVGKCRRRRGPWRWRRSRSQRPPRVAGRGMRVERKPSLWRCVSVSGASCPGHGPHAAGTDHRSFT